MTISVFWEFGEFTMDRFFGLDMQKDTVLSEISSIMLDPEGGNTPVAIREITEVTVNGEKLENAVKIKIQTVTEPFDFLVIEWLFTCGFVIFSYFWWSVPSFL